MRKFNIQDLVEVLCGATFTAKFITFFCQYNFIHTKSRKTPNLSFSVCGDTDNSHQRLAGSCSFTTAGERCPAYYTVEPVPRKQSPLHHTYQEWKVLMFTSMIFLCY